MSMIGSLCNTEFEASATQIRQIPHLGVTPPQIPDSFTQVDLPADSGNDKLKMGLVKAMQAVLCNLMASLLLIQAVTGWCWHAPTIAQKFSCTHQSVCALLAVGTIAWSRRRPREIRRPPAMVASATDSAHMWRRKRHVSIRRR